MKGRERDEYGRKKYEDRKREKVFETTMEGWKTDG